jgi:hypothetical protein
MSMPVLTCRRVRFFSEGDELAFFESIRRIKAVRRVEGSGDSILLHVPRRLSDTALREIIALFQRYRISMRQLAQFLSETNSRWFADPQKSWHKRVFANPAAPALRGS